MYKRQGIDFAFVRVASRDTSDGSIYEDTAADSHIQAALENDINVGLYILSLIHIFKVDAADL